MAVVSSPANPVRPHANQALYHNQLTLGGNTLRHKALPGVAA